MLGVHPLTSYAIEELRRRASSSGLKFRVTSVYRSLREQRALEQRRKTGQQKYPVAAPGRSTHNWGLAFDAVAVGAPQQRLVELAEGLGLFWAGPKDPVHFQILSQGDWSWALQQSPGNPLKALRPV